MANKKVTDLPLDNSPSLDDLILTVDAPGTTPVSKHTTLDDVFDLFFAQDISTIKIGILTGLSTKTQSWEFNQWNTALSGQFIFNSFPARTNEAPLICLEDHYINTVGVSTYVASAILQTIREPGSTGPVATMFLELLDRSNNTVTGTPSAALVIGASPTGSWTNTPTTLGIWMNVSDGNQDGTFAGMELDTSNYIRNNTGDWHIPDGGLPAKAGILMVDWVTQNPGSIPYYSDCGLGIIGYRYGFAVKTFLEYGIAIGNSYLATKGTGLLIDGSIEKGIDLTGGTFAKGSILATLPIYANNAAAVAGGLSIGAFYRTGANPDPVCVVH